MAKKHFGHEICQKEFGCILVCIDKILVQAQIFVDEHTIFETFAVICGKIFDSVVSANFELRVTKALRHGRKLYPVSEISYRIKFTV